MSAEVSQDFIEQWNQTLQQREVQFKALQESTHPDLIYEDDVADGALVILNGETMLMQDGVKELRPLENYTQVHEEKLQQRESEISRFSRDLDERVAEISASSALPREKKQVAIVANILRWALIDEPKPELPYGLAFSADVSDFREIVNDPTVMDSTELHEISMLILKNNTMDPSITLAIREMIDQHASSESLTKYLKNSLVYQQIMNIVADEPVIVDERPLNPYELLVRQATARQEIFSRHGLESDSELTLRPNARQEYSRRMAQLDEETLPVQNPQPAEKYEVFQKLIDFIDNFLNQTPLGTVFDTDRPGFDVFISGNDSWQPLSGRLEAYVKEIDVNARQADVTALYNFLDHVYRYAYFEIPRDDSSPWAIHAEHPAAEVSECAENAGWYANRTLAEHATYSSGYEPQAIGVSKVARYAGRLNPTKGRTVTAEEANRINREMASYRTDQEYGYGIVGDHERKALSRQTVGNVRALSREGAKRLTTPRLLISMPPPIDLHDANNGDIVLTVPHNTYYEIPGFNLTGQQKLSSKTKLYYRADGPDPYTEGDMALSSAQAKKIIDDLKVNRATKVASAVSEHIDTLTVRKLADIISTNSFYATGKDRHKGFLADDDGHMHMQCSGAAVLLEEALMTARLLETSKLSGYFSTGKSRITGEKHVQVAVRTADGGLIIVDPTPSLLSKRPANSQRESTTSNSAKKEENGESERKFGNILKAIGRVAGSVATLAVEHMDLTPAPEAVTLKEIAARPPQVFETPAKPEINHASLSDQAVNSIAEAMALSRKQLMAAAVKLDKADPLHRTLSTVIKVGKTDDIDDFADELNQAIAYLDLVEKAKPALVKELRIKHHDPIALGLYRRVLTDLQTHLAPLPS